MIVKTPGGAFDVVQTGTGPDVVFFHSLLTDQTVFDAVTPALGRTHRLTLVNLPGFGDSSPAGPRIEDYADRVAELFPALGLPPATDVVAMSLGGFMALALAARHGRLFRRLAVVDAAAAFPATAKPALRAMADRAETEGMAAIVDTAVRRMFTEAFIAAHPDIIEARAARLVTRNPRYFATACRALADLDLHAVLGAIRNPTVVMVGTLDATTPPALSRELVAGIRGARYVEIADSAHCPPLEKPVEFLAAVQDFLRGA